jgi:hypothetical protein
MKTTTVPMEIRAVHEDERLIEGIVAPYDEVSLLTGDPYGERILRHAFTRSITQRGDRIPLFINHDHNRGVGMSRDWSDSTDGLTGVFRVRDTPEGDKALLDVREKYLTGMSVGFIPVDRKPGKDGVMEVREARLFEVSLCLIGAYEGAAVLASRVAQQTEDLLRPFANPPELPIPFVAPWG